MENLININELRDAVSRLVYLTHSLDEWIALDAITLLFARVDSGFFEVAK